MVSRLVEVFLAALKLGLTSFGGPFAHLGFFHKEYVVRRQWISQSDFAALVALCQVLPGPTSSQVGIGIGRARAGRLGGIVAWLGFTAPSALIMVVGALWWSHGEVSSAVIRGLAWTAFAVVAHATGGLARSFTAQPSTAFLAGACAFALALKLPPVLTIAVGGLMGWFLAPGPSPRFERRLFTTKATVLWWWVVLGAALLVVLPLVNDGQPLMRLVDTFYRTGFLVFGGGHVVLPLLAHDLLGQKLVTAETLVQGYGLAQIVPGPLFSIAAYLGWSVAGPWGAVVSLLAIFLPSFVLLEILLPLWGRWQNQPWVARALKGVQASVVGLLVWSLYQPLGVQAVHEPLDVLAVLGLFALLQWAKAPSWLVVLAAVLSSLLLSFWLPIPASATLP